MAALAAPPATPRGAARTRPHGPPRRDGARPHVHGRAEASRLRLSALLTGASPDRDVTLQRRRVAPGLAIAALSAEPVAEYGPILRSQEPGIVIPVGYTDTVFGYLPSARMLGQHGYEDEGFMEAFGMAGRFRPDIEAVVRQAWGELSPADGG